MRNIIASFLIAVLSVGSVFFVAYHVSASEHAADMSKVRESLEKSDSELTVVERTDAQPLALRKPAAEPEHVSESTSEVAVEENEKIEDEPAIVASTDVVENVTRNAVETGEVRGAAVEVEAELEQPAEDTETFIFDEELIAEIFRLTNLERASAGLPPFVPDRALTAIAEGHSADMAADGFFAHADDDGCMLTCRLKQHDYAAAAWAENISQVKKSDLLHTKAIAALMVESWMESGGHRENILSDTYTNTGIGIAYDGRTVYATADYALPK